MILPKERDRRLITLRRGGTLVPEHHRLLALWAAACAQHVLDCFEGPVPGDPRPRAAIDAARAWARGELTVGQARFAAGAAQDAARAAKGRSEPARLAALSAGQAAVVPHVAAHQLGAAAYAIRAVMAAAPAGAGERARRQEWHWQRARLHRDIRELVLEDARLRNSICWYVFGEDAAPTP